MQTKAVEITVSLKNDSVGTSPGSQAAMTQAWGLLICSFNGKPQASVLNVSSITSSSPSPAAWR